MSVEDYVAEDGHATRAQSGVKPLNVSRPSTGNWQAAVHHRRLLASYRLFEQYS